LRITLHSLKHYQEITTGTAFIVASHNEGTGLGDTFQYILECRVCCTLIPIIKIVEPGTVRMLKKRPIIQSRNSAT